MRNCCCLGHSLVPSSIELKMHPAKLGHVRPIAEVYFSAPTQDGVFLISACHDKLVCLTCQSQEARVPQNPACTYACTCTCVSVLNSQCFVMARPGTGLAHLQVTRAQFGRRNFVARHFSRQQALAISLLLYGTPSRAR